MAIVLGKYSSFHTNAPLDASISRLTRVLHLHKGKKGKNINFNCRGICHSKLKTMSTLQIIQAKIFYISPLRQMSNHHEKSKYLTSEKMFQKLNQPTNIP